MLQLATPTISTPTPPVFANNKSPGIAAAVITPAATLNSIQEAAASTTQQHDGDLEEKKQDNDEDEGGRGGSSSSVGSCGSWVEALQAAKEKEEKEKMKPPPPRGRRNSLFTMFQKKEKGDSEEPPGDTTNKPKLRQTSSHTLSVANTLTINNSGELQRGFRSEGDLFVSGGNNAATADNGGGQDAVIDDHSQPPASAPPIPRGRRDSLAFVRKMSKKIRNTITSNHEAGSSDEDADRGPPRFSRSTSKKDKPARFEVVDLSAEDVAHNPPHKKFSYAQLLSTAGMSSLILIFSFSFSILYLPHCN